MDKELQKRLEEAAVNITVDIIDRNPQPVYFAAIREAAFRGAELGNKEAIALAKEWLKERLGDDIFLCNGGWLTCKEFISDFEADMNKLLEEEK